MRIQKIKATLMNVKISVLKIKHASHFINLTKKITPKVVAFFIIKIILRKVT
jgi:hypothetical protein